MILNLSVDEVASGVLVTVWTMLRHLCNLKAVAKSQAPNGKVDLAVTIVVPGFP